jgi:fatty-acid desaturase
MFYNFKIQSSSQMQIFFPSSSASLLASYTPLLIYIQRMRHVVSVHPAMVVNSLQHFWDKNLL